MCCAGGGQAIAKCKSCPFAVLLAQSRLNQVSRMILPAVCGSSNIAVKTSVQSHHCPPAGLTAGLTLGLKAGLRLPDLASG